MADSLKYGIPGGLVASLAYVIQWLYLTETSPIWRWFLIASIVLVLSLLSLRERNRAYFPFRFVFLSGFNISVMMVILQAIVLFAFSDQLLQPAVEAEISLKWSLFQVYLESMGFMFVSLLATVVCSFALRRKPPKPNG